MGLFSLFVLVLCLTTTVRSQVSTRDEFRPSSKPPLAHPTFLHDKLTSGSRVTHFLTTMLRLPNKEPTRPFSPYHSHLTPKSPTETDGLISTRRRWWLNDAAALSYYTCQDRCDTRGHDKTNWPCQCNVKCMEFQDCCPDYGPQCLSCEGRCEVGFHSQFPCQCNEKCSKFGDCCRDFSHACDYIAQANFTVTDAQLREITETLWRLEGPNNAADLVRVNLQNRTTFATTQDRASHPLLSVTASAYRKSTIAKLIPLHNNYVASAAQAEVVTPQETTEESQFLDEILSTQIMRKTEEFLQAKGYLPNQRTQNGRLRSSNRAFREALHQIWFQMYSRERGVIGSSGFEHIFLGETKNGQVSGFHNWVFFSQEESKNHLDYYGHMFNLRLGPKGSIIKHKFKWNGSQKPVSTMFVGTSPELEMALYTICFYSRPGTRCPVALNGKTFNIQTHYFTKQGKRFVASAYPDI